MHTQLVVKQYIISASGALVLRARSNPPLVDLALAQPTISSDAASLLIALPIKGMPVDLHPNMLCWCMQNVANTLKQPKLAERQSDSRDSKQYTKGLKSTLR